MNRLTYRALNGKGYVKEQYHDKETRTYYMLEQVAELLTQYEETDLTPQQIMDLKLQNEKSTQCKSAELPFPFGSEVFVTVSGKVFYPAKLYGKDENGIYLVRVKVKERHFFDWFRKIYSRQEMELKLRNQKYVPDINVGEIGKG